MANKLAREIEGSEGYRARQDLENGDGDEEDKFSAVVRPMGNGTGKWVRLGTERFYLRLTLVAWDRCNEKHGGLVFLYM